MTIVLGLLLGGALVTTLAPYLLRAQRWQVRRPAIALLIWVVVFTVGCGALLLGSVIAVVTAAAQDHRDHNEWVLPTLIMLAAWIVLILAGATLAAVLTRAQSWSRDTQRQQSLVVLLTASACCEIRVVDGLEVAIVEAPAPLALTTREHGPRVVVSRGLVDALEPAQLMVVIEHERTHLRWRHDLLTSLAGIAYAALPWLPAGREFARSTRLLTELAADDRAARLYGPEVCASALERWAELDGGASPGTTLRARRLRAA